MELFSLLVTLCLLVLMNDPMRGRDPPFIGGEEGCIPWIPFKWKEQTTFLHIDCTANTLGTVIGEAA
jgi:hypothetical protein